jgi:CheY-like chemotaxis protein
MPHRTIELLLVEDNPGDIRLAQETLKDYKLQNTLHVVHDGEQAMAFLRRQGKYAAAPTPDMMLLDLNLPRMDGFELLDEMHSDPALKDIPVVILTSSKHDRHMLQRHKIPTDCYIVKPLTVERYLEAVRCFPHLGVSIVRIASA